MKTIIAALMLLAATTSARAIGPDFIPFDPGKPPQRFPLRVLTASWPSGQPYSQGTADFHRAGDKQASLRIDWGDSGGKVSLLPFGRFTPISAPIEGSVLCGAEASQAELNGDGVPDYIIVSHSGGNGLAAQYTYVIFILSSPNGYVARTVLSYDAEAVDLVDLNGDGRPEFVHCMFVWGDVGTDGRSHNYWVYNLIGFDGTNIVSANSSDRRFPKWIMYGNAPNHVETRQLNADQRERQWLKAWEWEELASRGRPVFPNPAAFAKEQRRNAVMPKNPQ